MIVVILTPTGAPFDDCPTFFHALLIGGSGVEPHIVDPSVLRELMYPDVGTLRCRKSVRIHTLISPFSVTNTNP